MGRRNGGRCRTLSFLKVTKFSCDGKCRCALLIGGAALLGPPTSTDGVTCRLIRILSGIKMRCRCAVRISKPGPFVLSPSKKGCRVPFTYGEGGCMTNRFARRRCTPLGKLECGVKAGCKACADVVGSNSAIKLCGFMVRNVRPCGVRKAP